MGKLLEAVEAAFNRLIFALAALVALSIGLITVGIALNLVLLKTGTGSIWWLYEAVEYTLYVGVFIAAPWVLQQGAHVRVDVLTAALPRRLSMRLEQLLDVAGAALCAVLCYYGARAATMEFEFGTLPDKDLRIANWIMLTIFAGAFALLGIEFLLRIRRAGETIRTEAGL
ncbi:MAG: TRAP transporter small permease [Alphaproteobacteria bacterium]